MERILEATVADVMGRQGRLSMIVPFVVIHEERSKIHEFFAMRTTSRGPPELLEPAADGIVHEPRAVDGLLGSLHDQVVDLLDESRNYWHLDPSAVGYRAHRGHLKGTYSPLRINSYGL
jgi:hypothetical protein